MNLYKPIIFKRWQLSKWEKGYIKINSKCDIFLEEDRKTVVTQVCKFKIKWV